MKTIDRAKAQTNSPNVRSSSRPRPESARGVGGGQVHRRHRGAQRLQPVGHREPGRHRGPEANLALPVETVDPRGARHPLDPRHAFELHHPSALPRDHEPPDRPGVGPVLLAEPELHFVVLVVGGILEARDLLVPADQEPDRRADPLRVDAKVRGAGPVDLDPQLGLVEPERRVGVKKPEGFLAVAQALRVCRKRVEVRSPENEVDIEGSAADVESDDVPDRDAKIAILAESPAHLLHHLKLGAVSAERGEGVQARGAPHQPGEREDALPVRGKLDVRPPLAHPADPPAPGGREHHPHSGHGPDLGDDVVHDPVHAGQARALRGGHVQVELPLVRVGREVILADQRRTGGWPKA